MDDQSDSAAGVGSDSSDGAGAQASAGAGSDEADDKKTVRAQAGVTRSRLRVSATALPVTWVSPDSLLTRLG